MKINYLGKLVIIQRVGVTYLGNNSHAEITGRDLDYGRFYFSLKVRRTFLVTKEFLLFVHTLKIGWKICSYLQQMLSGGAVG